ncbi:MAG: ATPase [Candidatus Diapherotrites archaeon]|nr:ATPase [Candidatus Diapherotrites archaeon]
MALLEGPAGIAIGAGLAMAGAALATAWAQSAIGSSAMGTIAERPDQATKLIIWLAIPETIVILGFVIALLLTFQVAPAA